MNNNLKTKITKMNNYPEIKNTNNHGHETKGKVNKKLIYSAEQL
jgi:hypothetical protein